MVGHMKRFEEKVEQALRDLLHPEEQILDP
jgi:hypothetical protein